MVYILWVSYTLKTRVIDWHVLLCFQKIVFFKMKTPSWFKTHYISSVSLEKQCFEQSFLVGNNKKTKNSQNCIVNHNPDQVLCYRNCNQLAFLHRKHAHSNIWADNYFDCKTCIFDISKLQLSCKMFNLNNVANGLVATTVVSIMWFTKTLSFRKQNVNKNMYHARTTRFEVPACSRQF